MFQQDILHPYISFGLISFTCSMLLFFNNVMGYLPFDLLAVPYLTPGRPKAVRPLLHTALLQPQLLTVYV